MPDADAREYSYHPPKSNHFGHVPLTKDRVKLLQTLRAFLAKHAVMDSISVQVMKLEDDDQDDDEPLAPRGTTAAERLEAGMQARYGEKTCGDHWQIGGADLEPCTVFIEEAIAWPDWDDLDVDLAVGVHFSWRLDALAGDGEPPISFMIMYLGHRRSSQLCQCHLLQLALSYRRWDTLKAVEPEFRAFKLFRPNPAHYRLDGRKLKPPLP
jgi:hypothetical protein